MALAIGNVINGGTAKGQADGFDMGVVSSQKLSRLKDMQGETLMQYICKQVTEENPEFPFQLQELIKLLSDNLSMTNIKATQTKTGELEAMFEVAAAARQEVESYDEPADRFKTEVGRFIEEKARTELGGLKTATADVLQMH